MWFLLPKSQSHVGTYTPPAASTSVNKFLFNNFCFHTPLSVHGLYASCRYSCGGSRGGQRYCTQNIFNTCQIQKFSACCKLPDGVRCSQCLVCMCGSSVNGLRRKGAPIIGEGITIKFSVASAPSKQTPPFFYPLLRNC